jgi:hypothetical protein
MAMNFEGKINDALTVVDVIDAQTITAGATGVLTAAIDMSKYSKLIAIISSGTLGSSGTLDGYFSQSTATGGTYYAITAKTFTQLVKASNDNDIVILELDRVDVAAAGYAWVKLRLVAGTANSISGAVVLGVPANAGLASATNNADVVQIL